MRNVKNQLEGTNTIQPEHIALSHQQTEEAVTLFKHYDIDGNGSITKEELKKIMSSFEQPLDEAEINLYFSQFDLNESNGIDFHEFLGVIKYWLANEMNRLAESEVLGSSFELDELQVIVRYFSIFLFNKEQVLQKVGDTVDSVSIIISGVAVAEKDQTRQLLTEGSIFGATHGVKLSAYDTTVTAETNGIVLSISIDQIAELVAKHPLITLKLNQSLDYKLTSMITKFTSSGQR